MSTIIITGANQGIGYYMAEKFLMDGHSVAVLDLEINNLLLLKEKYADKLLPYICDMRNTSDINKCVSKIAGLFKNIDITIHNACRCTFESMDTTSEDTYKEVLDVNFFGALRLTKAVIPYMQKRHKGKVIFTSSGVGVMGFFNISPYASSKGAIESLAKCLSIEYQNYGIDFHIIHPPITRTKSSDPFPLPKEFKADPKTVGYGLANHIDSKSFVICHSFSQKLQTKLCYLLSIKMGRFMSCKMTDKFIGEHQ